MQEVKPVPFLSRKHPFQIFNRETLNANFYKQVTIKGMGFYWKNSKNNKAPFQYVLV